MMPDRGGPCRLLHDADIRHAQISRSIQKLFRRRGVVMSSTPAST
jgi:hypothetical protein